MSDRGRRERWGKDLKWSIIGLFVVLSPLLGLLTDICFIFPPSGDSHGHSVPIFTILLPLFAIFVMIVAALIELIALIVKALNRTVPDQKCYEYLKISQECNGVHTPALILHEIDPDAGRCSMRCIYIYQDGHVENYVNNGVYAPVPTVESIHVSDALHSQTAYIMTGREFENVWNSGRYMGPWAL